MSYTVKASSTSAIPLGTETNLKDARASARRFCAALERGAEVCVRDEGGSVRARYWRSPASGKVLSLHP